MSYTLPADVDERPVVIDGAGTLGRRIATMYAAGGTDVRIFDLSEEQREAARRYANDHAEQLRHELNLDASRVGAVETSDELSAAVRGAWMVIEAVPEKLEVKRQVFAQLDELAEPDVIRDGTYPDDPDLRQQLFIASDQPVHRRRAAPKTRLEHAYQQPPAAVGRAIPPFRLMDRVRLDVVLNIEEHYAEVRPGIPEGPRKLLRQHCSARGRDASTASSASRSTPPPRTRPNRSVALRSDCSLAFKPLLLMCSRPGCASPSYSACAGPTSTWTSACCGSACSTAR
jgi:3-hydroxybutyryl-CoA dehydrogenase